VLPGKTRGRNPRTKPEDETRGTKPEERNPRNKKRNPDGEDDDLHVPSHLGVFVQIGERLGIDKGKEGIEIGVVFYYLGQVVDMYNMDSI